MVGGMEVWHQKRSSLLSRQMEPSSYVLIGELRENLMSKFDPETITAMRTVLDEVCSHIPAQSTAARTFVAARILECATSGKQSHDLLMEAGRRAVIEQFGSIDAVRGAFAWRHAVLTDGGL